MVYGEHGGRHKPGYAKNRADDDAESHNEKIEMVAASLVQLVLLPVADDSGDLLIHEEEDGGKDGGEESENRCVNRVPVEGRHQPSSAAQCWRKSVRHHQLWSSNTNQHVCASH